MNIQGSPLEKSITSLLEYCRGENWSGYDPYDGLKSRLLLHLPLMKSKVFRLVVTQTIKRSPINFRALLRIPKGESPKACALFCSALIRLSGNGFVKAESLIRPRLDQLMALRSSGYDFTCWGYDFDWQGRSFLLPKFEPNIICTTFGGNALLDAYEKYGEKKHLDAAASAGDFLLHGLRMTREGEGVCLSYTPYDQERIHNANLLGAALLARLFHLTGNTAFRDTATKAMRFSIDKQRADGSWPYGETKTQSWIDNFHTGYNLVALKRISDFLGDPSIAGPLRKGLRFYIERFFTSHGIPKYYASSVWPIDIHSVAQSLVTLCELHALDERTLPLARKVCTWAMENMQNERGDFIYQKTHTRVNRISYMRWSQAWMLYALSIFSGSEAAGNGDS